MTEITRVPLLPIARGSLVKIWLGVVLVIAAGVWLALATSISHETIEGGIKIVTLKKGDGGTPSASDVVLINYRGKLADGTVFDEGQQKPFEVGGVIPGFSEALQKMQPKGRYLVHIPAAMAYGDRASPSIPAGSDLDFEIELLEFRTREQVMQMMQQQQAMQRLQQQQMQQRGGAPGGPHQMQPEVGPPDGMPPQ